MNKLNPCPFCGGNDIAMELYETELGDRYSANCRTCYASGPLDLGESGASEQWNKRAEAINTVTVNQTAENVTGTMIGMVLP